METDIERDMLLAAIKSAEDKVDEAKAKLREYDARRENNTFDSLDSAERILTVRFRRIADDECGSYRLGDLEYTQQFMVDGELYEATIEIEYNRHDKRWYYVDESKYSYKKL